jgi:hypothetical protein
VSNEADVLREIHAFVAGLAFGFAGILKQK